MRLLKEWLRTYKGQIALTAALMMLFPLIHVLGGGRLRELRYTLTLCGLLCGGVAAVSLFFLGKKLRTLRIAKKNLPEEAASLPAATTPVEEGWRALAETYQTQFRELSGQTRQEARETADYYAMWLHQIKTPLAALDLMAQTPGELDRNLLKQEALKIEQYAAIALDWQRLQSLHEDLHLTHVALYPLCCQAVRRLRPLFQYGQISLHLSPFEGEAVTDAKWLLTVLTQVLTNALKYTPPGGCITVAQDEPDVLTVSDTGIGIRPEDQARVFDRGFTGHTGRAQEKSTGIGLYLCKRICDELGHRIFLTSTVGQGTCVTLDLRREEPLVFD